MIVAIHPDNYGPGDASSPLWTKLLTEQGHTVRPVNVRAADIIEQVKDADGFMWRWAHFHGMYRIARRLLPVLEREMGMAVYPSQSACWHYDDKIAQSYLATALGIPMPKTWVFFHPEEARRFIESASFPLVVKLACGAGSSNVALVRSKSEAIAHSERMFTRGCYALSEEPAAVRAEEFQFGYAIFQEFVPGNDFDTRVTVIGNRAFAYRRFNRPNDFRASGSKQRSADPAQIAPDCVRLAFDVAAKLKSHSCAVDCLHRDGKPVVSEFSYTYVSQFIYDCPGHWELAGQETKWVDGSTWPEQAQVEDFVALMNARGAALNGTFMTQRMPDDSLFGRRVAVVLNSFDLGGAERQALHLASYLRDTRGAKVAVVGLFGGLGGQPIRRMCVQRSLTCLRVNMPELAGGIPTSQSVEQFARDLAFLQPDILLPYTSLPNILCGAIWEQTGAALCVWNQRDEGRDLPRSPWLTAALSGVSRIISNSRDGADFLVSQRGVRRERIELVFNGVELPAPGAFERPASGLLAVMVANIHPYKDHATLARAWKIVRDKLPERQPLLLLAGREEDGQALRQLIASLGIADHARLLGAVADVSGLLHAADLAVFSSRAEGTPNAVLESMAAGLAVVATDIPGCRDALGEDYPALVPPGDAQAMANRIIALAENPAERGRLGAASRERCAKEFGVRKMCERTCAILSRGLAQGSGIST